jgi:hypothetical protein
VAACALTTVARGLALIAAGPIVATLTGVAITSGVAMASNRATALAVSYDNTNNKFVFYEGSAAATALTEKFATKRRKVL